MTGWGDGGWALEPRWPWLLPVVAAVVLVLLAWWSRRGPSRPAPGAVLVASAARLRALPRYRQLVRRRRAVAAVLTAGAVVATTGAAVLVARPTSVELVTGEGRSRDIMLCLDASQSMDDDNVAVVRAMRSVVDGLRGDRVGLTLWSSAAITVFPLTDDYPYVLAQLGLAEQAFRDGDEAFFAGVELPGSRSSLIGDGLVSCVQRFDRPEEDRSRAVVLTSDNDPFGRPVYSLPEAARYATEREVQVYAVGAPVLAEEDEGPARTELDAAVTSTGGTFAIVGADGATEDLVARIDELERTRTAQPTREVRRDDPSSGVVVAAAGAGLLGLAWLGEAVMAGRGAWRRRRDARGGSP